MDTANHTLIAIADEAHNRILHSRASGLEAAELRRCPTVI